MFEPVISSAISQSGVVFFSNVKRSFLKDINTTLPGQLPVLAILYKKIQKSSSLKDRVNDAKRLWRRTSKTLKWSPSNPGLKSGLNENGPLRPTY